MNKLIFLEVLALVTLKSQSQTLTDTDGNVYKTINIGTQVWMAENLKVVHYRNSDDIPIETDPTQWVNLAKGAYCQYDNDISFVNTYGRLYNWYVTNDSRNVCPVGWRVPAINDWTTMETYLGGNVVAGGKMKETGTTHWTTPNTGANNSSGFSGLPGGVRGLNGIFSELGIAGYWWSSTQTNETEVCGRNLWYEDSKLDGNCTSAKYIGLSIRCIKDTVISDSVNVTFQVNMQNQSVGSTGVLLNGSFCNWSVGVPMTISSIKDIYTTTLKLKKGDSITYKYTSGAATDWLIYENASDTCGYGTYNDRLLVVPENDLILGVTCYGGCGSCKVSTSDSVEVTFRVDMQNENISSKGVYVVGSFCNWKDGISMVDDYYDYYYTTIKLKKGEVITYKFVNGIVSDLANYESISGTCAYGSGANRILLVPDKKYYQDIVCFNNCNGCVENPNYNPISHQSGTLFPNPTDGMVTITGLLGDGFEFCLYNTVGRLMEKSRPKFSNSVLLNMEQYPAGIYTLVIKRKFQIQIFKIVKK